MLEIPLDTIRDSVYYDETSPTYLRYSKTTSKWHQKDSAAGYLSSAKYKYYCVTIAKKVYKSIRIIWALHHGEIPEGKFIIPKDGNQLNLNISNLEISDICIKLSDKNSNISKAYEMIEALSINQTPKDDRFYVYAHVDSEGIIRYVGKGTGKRAFSKKDRNKKWWDIFNNFSKENVVIIKDGLTNSEAFELEHELINKHKNDLVNLYHSSKPVKDISYEEIKDIVYYDTTSPTFLRWKVDRRLAKKDSVAGYKPKRENSYGVISINGEYYRTHRVVWVLFNKGIDQNLAVDHIDRDRTNNSIENLRLVTHSVNARNRQAGANVNDLKNISKREHYYTVSFTHNGVVKSTVFSKNRFGSFEAALEEAIKFRDKLIEKHLVILD